MVVLVSIRRSKGLCRLDERSGCLLEQSSHFRKLFIPATFSRLHDNLSMYRVEVVVRSEDVFRFANENAPASMFDHTLLNCWKERIDP